MRVELIGPCASVRLGTMDRPIPSASARARQKRDVTAAAVTEGEIGAASQMRRADASVQHIAHEGLGRQLGERTVERNLVEDLHTQRGQRVRPLPFQRQPERRVLRAEQLARMWLECQDGELGAGSRGMGSAQDVGMAAVHAVEIAERNRGAAQGIGQVTPGPDRPASRSDLPNRICL